MSALSCHLTFTREWQKNRSSGNLLCARWKLANASVEFARQSRCFHFLMQRDQNTGLSLTPATPLTSRVTKYVTKATLTVRMSPSTRLTNTAETLTIFTSTFITETPWTTTACCSSLRSTMTTSTTTPSGMDYRWSMVTATVSSSIASPSALM